MSVRILLHLEETRTEKEEPDSFRYSQQAYAWSRTRMGGWAVAQSPILATTITIERLASRGYESMLSYYEKVSPQLNEPLYTRPVRTVVVV